MVFLFLNLFLTPYSDVLNNIRKVFIMNLLMKKKLNKLYDVLKKFPTDVLYALIDLINIEIERRSKK